MKILITGGAGFIGSALANRLALAGHQVRVLDNLGTGEAARLRAEVDLTVGDVTDKPTLWRLLRRVDCVYHLAARVSVSESVLYPREYNATNVGGTVAVMEAMRDTKVKRVVFASSGAIYGEQSVSPVSETLSPQPTSPYAVSKLSAEYYVRTIGHLWGIETISLRIFNAYGPGQSLPSNHPPVVPHFLRRILGGGSLTIHGSGGQVRDFVYVDDVVSALVAAATMQGVNQPILNIGSGIGHSISHLIAELAQVTGRKPQILQVPGTQAGVSRLVADISLARRWLNYQPQVSLSEGLRRLLAEDARFKR